MENSVRNSCWHCNLIAVERSKIQSQNIIMLTDWGWTEFPIKIWNKKYQALECQNDVIPKSLFVGNSTYHTYKRISISGYAVQFNVNQMGYDARPPKLVPIYSCIWYHYYVYDRLPLRCSLLWLVVWQQNTQWSKKLLMIKKDLMCSDWVQETLLNYEFLCQVVQKNIGTKRA